MRKITVSQESIAYRGLETVIATLANGDKIEIKVWDNERLHSRMDYSVKLVEPDGRKVELVAAAAE